MGDHPWTMTKQRKVPILTDHVGNKRHVALTKESMSIKSLLMRMVLTLGVEKLQKYSCIATRMIFYYLWEGTALARILD